MSLQARWNAWAALSTLKRSAIVVGLVVGLVVTAWLVYSVSGWFTGRHDAKFDEQRAAEAAERQILANQTVQLTVERDAAIQRADAAEKVGDDLKVQIAAKDLALAAAGQKVQGIDDRLMEEDARYIKELEASGRVLTMCERFIRNCQNAIRLGLRPKSQPCECRSD